MKIVAVSTSPFLAKRCSGVTPSQSGSLGFIPCWKRSSFSSRVLPADRDRVGRSGWYAQHQTQEQLLALFRGMRERLEVIRQRRIGRENGCRSLDIAVIREKMHSSRRSIRSQQIDHRLVIVPDRNDQRVGRAFDGRARKGAVLQQELRNFKVPVVNRRIQGMAVRGDALLGQVGIGPAVEKSFTISRWPLAAAFFSGAPEPI